MPERSRGDEMTWRIGIATGGCTHKPILDVLEPLARAGFPGIEVGTPPRHFDPWEKSQVEAVAEHLQRNRVAAVSIHAPFGGILDLSDPNPHHRAAAIGGILQAASVLHRLGGSIVVVHPTDVPRSAETVGARLAACADALSILARSCAGMGLRLAVESPLPHLIGGHPDEFRWILGRLDGHAGVCLDTSHTFLGHHWKEFVEAAGASLIHVHACDNRGSFDDHLPPGEGMIDWGLVVESLRVAKYDGWIMLELACIEESQDAPFARIRSSAERIFNGGS